MASRSPAFALWTRRRTASSSPAATIYAATVATCGDPSPRIHSSCARSPSKRPVRGTNPSSRRASAPSQRGPLRLPNRSRPAVELDVAAGQLADPRDRVKQLDRAPAADVVDPPGPPELGGGERARHHVVDEREVAYLTALAVDREPTAGQRAAEELGERHVRTLARPVRREVAQPDDRHAEAAQVDRGELLRCHLRQAVRGERLARAQLGGRVHPRVPVDRRGRRVDERDG